MTRAILRNTPLVYALVSRKNRVERDALWSYARGMKELFLVLAVATAVPSLTVRFSPQNDSHESGVAVLSADGNATRVIITLSGEPRDGVQPANLHAGTCDAVAAIRFPLSDVRAGRSVSRVAVPLHALRSAPYVIVVQDSPASLHAAKDYKYVTCATVGLADSVTLYGYASTFTTDHRAGVRRSAGAR